MKTFGVILAGGQSSRFLGKDKSWIQWKGAPLIQHVIERIQPQTDQLVISANQNLDKYRALGFPVISDDDESFQGPLAGILSIMNYLSRSSSDINQTRLLTAPCDMPLLPNKLTTLLDHPVRKQQLCVARDSHRIQPLVALIPLSLRDHLNDYLNNGHRKTEQWVLSTDPQVIDLSKLDGCFYNINNSDELNKLESLQDNLKDLSS